MLAYQRLRDEARAVLLAQIVEKMPTEVGALTQVIVLLADHA